MMRLTLILAAALAAASCGSRRTQTRGDEPASAKNQPDAGPPLPIKQVLIAWALVPSESGPTRTTVSLALTDEMGRVTNHPLGTYDGTCTDVGGIELYSADAAVTCGQGGKGVQLHAVAGRGEVLVYAMDIAEGTEPDPMARRQIADVDVPIDAKVSAQPH
jgi:hypothetical protein